MTCARCGQQVPPGYAMCPRCGAPLDAPRPAASDVDPNLPEWMRQGQGAQPGQPPSSLAAPGSLSVGSLLSDDAVPDWLRTAGGGAPPAAAPDPWSGGAASPGAWTPPPPGPAVGGWPPQASPSSGYAGTPNAGFAPGGAPTAAGVFNESALPDWLREATAGQAPPHSPQVSAASPFVSGLAPGATPGPATPYPPQSYGAPARASQYPAGGHPGGGLAANALFDAGALPTWLGGTGNSGQPAPPATPLGGDGLQVSSLVDERSLPVWLRQEPEQTPAQTPMPGSVSRWLSAPVTGETMPPFLHQVYDGAQVARTELPASAPEYWGAAATPATPPLPGAVPGAQLLDDSVLPQWLRAQAGAPAASPPPAATPPRVYQPPAGLGAASPSAPRESWGGVGGSATATPPGAAATGAAGSFAASDLIEPGAVPTWVQQGAPPPQQSFSSTAGWTDHTPAVAPPASTGTHQGMTMNPGWNASAMSAPAADASLPSWLQTPDARGEPAAGGWTAVHAGVRRARESAIPPSELPPWLREGAAEQPAAAQAAPAPQPASTDEQWDELQRGWDGDESDHYMDRFGVEEPGSDRPFSMEYDQQLRTADGTGEYPGEYSGEQRARAPERGKGKRKRFGR